MRRWTSQHFSEGRSHLRMVDKTGRNGDFAERHATRLDQAPRKLDAAPKDELMRREARRYSKSPAEISRADVEKRGEIKQAWSPGELSVDQIERQSQLPR